MVALLPFIAFFNSGMNTKQDNSCYQKRINFIPVTSRDFQVFKQANQCRAGVGVAALICSACWSWACGISVADYNSSSEWGGDFLT